MGKKLLLVVCVSVLFMSACKPDLIVSSQTVTWNETAKGAEVVISNVGNADAGPFMVYFDAVENPVSPNHRPQIRHRVNGLARGATITLTADFLPLAHPDNQQLGNVYQIRTTADPKNEVTESNEDNNSRTSPL